MSIQESEQALLDFLLSWHGGIIPIIPTSDFAAMCIDLHFDVLSEKFLLPSIAKKQRLICEYMDKYKQIELAQSYNIRMAKSIVAELDKDEKTIFDKVASSIGYPCIMKPRISAKGNKTDIKRIESESGLAEAINYYRQKKYNEILIQEFVFKKNELCCFGCITENSRKAYFGTLKKIRYYPYEAGASLSFACFTKNEKMIYNVIDLLTDIGYSGLFDFELLETDEGDYLLNEINFRNSGNTWALVKNGLNIPYIWVSDAEGEEISLAKSEEVFEDEKYFMNETSDIHHVYDRRISASSWIADLLHTSAFNKMWIKDLSGTIPWYWQMISQKCGRNKVKKS